MSLFGIDISSWQSGIDLSVVPCDFVIIKATQGTGYVNPDYNRAVKQAEKQKKLIGLYHYASSGGAVAEADFFLKTVKSYIKKAVLVLDWESGDNVNYEAGPKYAKQFLDRVYEKTGIRPLIYISKSVCRFYDWSKVAKYYKLWVAQYANNEAVGYIQKPWTDSYGYGPWKSPAIFQYSSNGRLKGWNNGLDVNIAYLSKTEWQKLAGMNVKTEQKETKKKTNKKGQNNPKGTTLSLVYAVMKGNMGVGKDRKKALGKRYGEVQKLINHVDRASVSTLVRETKSGKYGVGEVRKTVLGKRYQSVMDRINGTSYYTIKSGDTLIQIAEKYHTTVDRLVAMNGIKDRNVIYTGQKLRIK